MSPRMEDTPEDLLKQEGKQSLIREVLDLRAQVKTLTARLDDAKARLIQSAERHGLSAGQAINALVEQSEAEFRAAIEATWQPINTAPKDGTRVLTLENESVEILTYDTHYNIWRDDGCDDCWDTHYPTYWMPLPKPLVGSK